MRLLTVLVVGGVLGISAAGAAGAPHAQLHSEQKLAAGYNQGVVDDLGSAGHVGGEGEGIDAPKLRSGRVHTLTVDPKRSPVWLGHFAVSPSR